MDGPRKGTAANVWEEDEIELKIDPQPKDSVTNSIWDTRLTALGMGTTGTGGGATVAADSMNNVPDSLKMWSRRIIPGGSALEWAIDWRAIKSGTGAEMVSVKLDSVFGLGINQHDNDKTARQASIIWAAFKDDAIWNTPKLLGTVKFLAGNKMEFTTTNKTTGRNNNPDKYDGTDVPLGVKEVQAVPTEFSLEQNYPNPFNPNTIISYSIPSNSHVRLAVYDMLGRQVAVLVDGMEVAGVYKVNFNAGNYASGVYFYRIEAGSHVKTQKMMLLK